MTNLINELKKYIYKHYLFIRAKLNGNKKLWHTKYFQIQKTKKVYQKIGFAYNFKKCKISIKRVKKFPLNVPGRESKIKKFIKKSTSAQHSFYPSRNG